MEPVFCDTCHNRVEREDAFSCTCGNYHFCSEKHFAENPHSSVEDDDHLEMNLLHFAPIEVKLSRLVGRGKYIDLMTRLAYSLINGSLDNDAGILRSGFIKNTASKNKTAMGAAFDTLTQTLKSEKQDEIFQSMKSAIAIWKSDAPRFKDDIENAARKFAFAIAEYNKEKSTLQEGRLNLAAYDFGTVLNGKAFKPSTNL